MIIHKKDPVLLSVGDNLTANPT